MALDKSHLDYPHRHYGMDHTRYDWQLLANQKPVTWPGGKKLALWVNVSLQFYPLNQKGVPFKVPGGMTMPYPDLRHYSLRDYGNRVGIYRFFKAFDRYGVTPTFAINTELARRYPYLLDAVKERDNEILCHGLHMDALHYGGQPLAEEEACVSVALDELRELSDQDVKGWLSPARNESEHTPELLVKNGVEYCCNWVNDDMPYLFNTENGPLWSMPLSNELEDRFILMNNQHSEDSYVEQIKDACNFLLKEAQTQGGRILALNIHPWLLGQPHRIHCLEAILDYVMAQDVWQASSYEILQHVRLAAAEA
ncbi:polysaccharide deacetylase family protein [Aestuariibacter sp. A3R04]|uniref:polysaccharide deacetylase family protein n=1 Tax=Aestuariibacter sp. A3R04 TaxID=2841571 RepID=UPI001C094E7B|nr:polysaccharide deacetylase family protein [Aestuariibacter sp. A3R04]MBU3023555.1 polysaccharide deacetylase family protein [Aestuariibacter sp. A3R04]